VRDVSRGESKEVYLSFGKGEKEQGSVSPLLKKGARGILSWNVTLIINLNKFIGSLN